MSNQKKRSLPNAEFIEDAYNKFSNLSEKVLELNSLYLEQAKNFWRAGVSNSEVLYQVSTPQELVDKLTSIMRENGANFSQALLSDINVLLRMCQDLCGSSAGGVQETQAHSLKIFDFYSKLLPSPLLYKFDDLIKNAAAGNHEALSSLQKLSENALSTFGSALEQGAKQTLENLAKVAEKVAIK